MLNLKAGLVALTVALAGATATAAEEDWIAESNRHALHVLEATAAFNPESTASQGIAKFDEQVFDLGPGYRERYTALERKLAAELRDELGDSTHPKVRQDLQILIRSLEDSVNRRELRSQHLLPYYNLHQTLFYNFRAALDPRIDSQRHAAALIKLKKYTGQIEGYTPITEQAQARTAEALENAMLLGPYRAELEADLENANRFTAGLRGMFENSSLSGWEADIVLLESQLEAYRQWLSQNLLPRARDNNLLPPEVYANNLINYGVRATPEELIADASAAYQAIRSEMKALAVRIARKRNWPDSHLVTVMRRLKEEQLNQDDILDVYRERLAGLEEIIREHDLLTLPEREASIRRATDAEAAAVPASFMSPPQLINNTGQYGEFVLVQKNPNLGDKAVMDDWSHDAITWALTAHEARPGHELQFARLVEDGTSIARAVYAFNSANVEGWGLYAESIVHPYLSEEAQLFSLFSRQMRAARMFMDPMINTGQLTADEASRFMQEEMALSLPMAESEANRYAFRMPGQATAYYYGYTKMLALRTELELRLGDAFNERDFHDFVLRQGLLPPDLLREATLAHFAPAD
jgi:uncharacterized protein (DUF885 family)